VCRFAKGDVMRHPLVQAIIEAYDEDDRRRAQPPGPQGDGPRAAPGGRPPTADP
jgi:hypothetical protein